MSLTVQKFGGSSVKDAQQQSKCLNVLACMRVLA